MIKNKEDWKDVPGFEGFYKANKDGAIKSEPRNGTHGGTLKLSMNRGGYIKVALYKNNVPHHFTAHQIIAKTFIPNPDNREIVNHINNIRTDNRVENLEWCTVKENLEHSHKQNRQRVNAVSILAVNSSTGERIEFYSQREAARKLKVEQTYISRMIRGKAKQKQINGWEFFKNEQKRVAKG